jgi:protocatechuate 3,4-dioxygenase beta subunit
MGPPPENHPTDKLTFLRGIQLTSDAGTVEFLTVFPGVYMGRTNHIHFKVRVGGQAGRSYQAGHTSHVGQIFFPEELAVNLMEREPYRRHQIHRTTQAEDQVFGDQQGILSIARVEQLHPQDPAAGLRAELIAAVDPTVSPAPAQRRGGPGGRPPY